MRTWLTQWLHCAGHKAWASSCVRAWPSLPLMSAPVVVSAFATAFATVFAAVLLAVFAFHSNALANDRLNGRVNGKINDESLLKAAFIFNFAQFTDWPDRAPSAKEETLSLCIAGNDVLAQALSGLKGKIIKDRVLVIEKIDQYSSSRHCNLLYIASSEAPTQSAWLKSIAEHPVLSVSELPGFAGNGGIFELYRDRSRVRFIVNLAVARQAGLKISPNLLKLATIVGSESASNPAR
jgi:hypothetical protein